MNRSYEEDTCQCQVFGTNKKRCTRIGTYSGGGLLRCKSHHGLYLRDKANAQPIKPQAVPR
jgi:hypothetical protein